MVSLCYLCDEPLDSTATSDHIIPNHLFKPGDPHRPKLPVHYACNNLKSKEDEWFVKQLQLRSAFDKGAEEEFSKLMTKAIIEKPDAYIIGKKLHNYKLAKGMFEGIEWGFELPYKDEALMQFKIPKNIAERFGKNVEDLCTGLYIRNIPSSKPSRPEIMLTQDKKLAFNGKAEGFYNSIIGFMKASESSLFMQRWDSRIFYVGSRVAETPDKGFIFIQFYTQFNILAVFR